MWLDPAYEHRASVVGVIKIHNREEQAEIKIRHSDGLMLDVAVYTAAPIPVDIYARHRATGLFLLIDPENERVIGVGTVTSLKDDAPVVQKRAVSV